MTENPRLQNIENLAAIADQFACQGTITNIRSLGNGNINDTFLVSLNDLNQGWKVEGILESSSKYFVLQRINTQVFRQPQLVMQNISILNKHICDRLQRNPLNRPWEVPHLILTKDGQAQWNSEDGSFWRAISFIEGSQSFDTLENLDQAREVGYALGMFHNLISDLPSEKLADTLAGFHITPFYLQQYDQVLAQTTVDPCPEVEYCLKFVSNRASWASILENAKNQGNLPLRTIHGDPKVNNVMFDIATGKAISVIDLDTVKPGLVHYDIGDCLRSGCNPAGEETEQWEDVHFDLDLCQSILQGYLSVAQAFLKENDYAYIYESIRLIAFELGLRFFTDYLAGNIYFKVKYPEHNLLRALVQFKLTESIESQKTSICKIIDNS